jgi:hypothetical protein
MEAASALDGAKQRLQAAAEKPATRVKAPSYTVFRFTGEENTLELLQQGVHATSRKEAIKALTKGGGLFLVIPDKEYQPITRKVETQTVDIFE